MPENIPDWFFELSNDVPPRKIEDAKELETIPEGSIMRNRFGTEFIWTGYHRSAMGLAFWGRKLPVYLVRIPWSVFLARLDEAARHEGMRLRKAELIRKVRTS